MAPTLTVELKTKKSEEELVRKEFRARPLPKDILEGVKVGLVYTYLFQTFKITTCAVTGPVKTLHIHVQILTYNKNFEIT